MQNHNFILKFTYFLLFLLVRRRPILVWFLDDCPGDRKCVAFEACGGISVSGVQCAFVVVVAIMCRIVMAL